MIRKYKGFRVFITMLAFGLASVPFFRSLQSEIKLKSIKSPETYSNIPLIVLPKYSNEMPFVGGSGPDGPDEPQPSINTLGTSIKPHIVKNADVQNIKLQNADLSESTITNSDFNGADFRRANFTKADIDYSGFAKVNFKYADFTGARLFGSDLTEADFSNANLRRANLAHSDFENAILNNVDLTDANLSDARLVLAKGLTYEQISKALISKFTSLPAKFESKRAVLVERSKRRMQELKKEMKAEELELFANQFDFLD